MHLLALVRDLPPPQPAKCSNCGEVECLNGKGIATPGKLTPGLKLSSIGIGVNGDIYASSRLFTVVEHVWRSNKHVNLLCQDRVSRNILIISPLNHLPSLCYKCD